MTTPKNLPADEQSADFRMRDCKHPWQRVSTVYEFGEVYDKCQLCDHIITSRLINNSRKQLLEKVKTQIIGEDEHYLEIMDANNISNTALITRNYLRSEQRKALQDMEHYDD